MKQFKDLNKQEQMFVKNLVLDTNTTIAGRGLLGFEVKKLVPSKENKKKFEEQFTIGHNGCGCYSCMELAKIFIDKSPDIKEEIISESTKDLESFSMSTTTI